MSSLFNRKNFFFFLAICLGSVLRMLALSDFSRLPLAEFPAGPDITEYLRRAQAILCGGIVPASVEIHAPLYPFFLAGLLTLSKNLLTVRLIQSVFCLVMTVIPLRILLKEKFSSCSGSKRFIPEITILILALYPPLIIYQLEFFSENLMIVFCTWSLCFLNLRMWKSFCSGIFGGLAVITHPLCIFFLPGAMVFLFLRGRKKSLWKPVILFAAGALLVILPVCIMNSLLAGHPAFVQGNGGFNFYLGNNPSSDGTCRIPPGIAWDNIHGYAAARAEAEKITKDQFFLRESWKFIKSYPLHFAENLGRKALLALNARELTTWSDITILQKTWMHKFGYQFFFGLLLVAAMPVLATGFFRKHLRDSLGVFYVLFLMIWAGQILTVTAGRYRLILILPLTVFSVYFLLCAKEFFKDRRSACGTVLLMGAGLLITAFPVKRDLRQERCYAESLLASSYLKASHPEEVLKLYPSDDITDPFRYRRLNFMGEAAVLTGKMVLAMRCFQQSVKDYPEMPEGYMNTGTLFLDAHQIDRARILFDKAHPLLREEHVKLLWEYNYGRLEQLSGNLEQAKKHYEATLNLDPAHDKTLNNYGTLLIRENQPEQAVSFFRRALILRGDDARLRLNLAVALAMSGKKAEAVKELHRILAAEPNNKGAAYLLQKLSPANQSE